MFGRKAKKIKELEAIVLYLEDELARIEAPLWGKSREEMQKRLELSKAYAFYIEEDRDVCPNCNQKTLIVVKAGASCLTCNYPFTLERWSGQALNG